jgi:hypothetical protein
MALTESECGRLLDALEKLGWHRRDNFLYAPHETMWLSIIQPWVDDGLQEFHDRMVGRLKRCRTFCNQNAVDDTAGLVRVLSEMIQNATT